MAMDGQRPKDLFRTGLKERCRLFPGHILEKKLIRGQNRSLARSRVRLNTAKTSEKANAILYTLLDMAISGIIWQLLASFKNKISYRLCVSLPNTYYWNRNLCTLEEGGYLRVGNHMKKLSQV